MRTRVLHNLGLASIAVLCLSFLLQSNVMAQYYQDNVLIIEQPHDVIECEGSIDQFLFVVAAPSQKQYKIAYRWWKDGRVISNWVEDFGQINFDTLRYKMSGLYRAEMFVFDPEYDGSTNGGSEWPSGQSYEEARISPIVFSEEANLYVLQRPEFLKDIKSVYSKEGKSLSLTFEAQVYGEHNMNNPTYWTQIQWFRGTTALTDNERYEGAQSSIFNIENIQTTDFATDYSVRLVGECDTVWSNIFAINKEPNALVTIQPVSVEGCIGDVVQLSVEAESTIPNVNLAYQWWVDGVMIMDEAGKFNGANSPNLNITLNTDLAYNGSEEFTCQVWPIGFPSNGVVSNAAKITWKTAPVLTLDLNNTYTAKEDEKVEFAITATGNNLTYTWTKDGVDLNNNTDTYTIDMVAMTDAGDYVATVTNECGEVTSTTATLAVTAGPIILTSVNANVGLGLSQNYPNPFGDNTTLTINSQVSGNATVVMTDMLGNVVANLHNGHVGMNTQTTININANNLNLNSGTYFITLRMGDKVETKQISVVR